MVNNEWLLAISDMMDKKLKSELQPIRSDIREVKEDVRGVKEELQEVKEDVQNMKEELQEVKKDVRGVKKELQEVKEDVRGIKGHMQELDQRVTNVEEGVKDIRLVLENETNHNIQLLAENFIELTNKLNQAIPAADKNLAYEVKVNHLISEVNELKRQMVDLKNRIA